MSKNFIVESREVCDCGQPITNKRSRKYCSKQCRRKVLNQKHRDYQRAWQRRRYDMLAEKPSKNKVKCILCGRWYRQVGTHVRNTHKITAREYREMHDLPLKRGILPPDLRQLKSEQVRASGAIQNIITNGEKHRFKNGDTKMAGRGWHGRAKLVKTLDPDIYPL